MRTISRIKTLHICIRKNAIQTLYRQIIGDYQSFFALKKSTKINEAKRLAAKPPGFKHGKLFNSYFTYNDFSVKYCLNDQDVVDRKYLNSAKLKTLSNKEKNKLRAVVIIGIKFNPHKVYFILERGIFFVNFIEIIPHGYSEYEVKCVYNPELQNWDNHDLNNKIDIQYKNSPEYLEYIKVKKDKKVSKENRREKKSVALQKMKELYLKNKHLFQENKIKRKIKHVKSKNIVDQQNYFSIDVGVNNLYTISLIDRKNNVCKTNYIKEENLNHIKILYDQKEELQSQLDIYLEFLHKQNNETNAKDIHWKSSVYKNLKTEDRININKLKFKIKKLLIQINREKKEICYKIASLIINSTIKNNVKTIIYGKNKNPKEKMTGIKYWQQFPHTSVFNRLKVISKMYAVNINVVEQEESYTSQASALDNDLIEKHKATGMRSKKNAEIYTRKNNTTINADLNATLNIFRKYLFALGESYDSSQIVVKSEISHCSVLRSFKPLLVFD